MMPVDITYFLNHPKDYQSLISEKTDAFAQRDVDIIMPFFMKQSRYISMISLK